MTQTQLLGFLIQEEVVTSTNVAKHFKVRINFAYQVLRRLQDKEILIKNGGPYRFNFQLSNQTKQKLRELTNNHNNYGWIFVVGLATMLLINPVIPKRVKQD